MKKIILALGVFFLLGIARTGFGAEIKIGYVDAEKVFSSYKKTEQLNNKLQVKHKKGEKEAEKRMKEIEQLREELKLFSESAKSARKKKEEIIEQKTKGLQEFVLKTRESLLKERAEMMNEILEDIDRAIQKEAKKGKYDLILNTRIADTPILLYGRKDLELTDEIIKELEKQ